MQWYDEILDIPDGFVDKCETYTKMLLNYTKTHNITALKNSHEVYENIVDAVYPLRYLKAKPKCVADIGSGAGFPGLLMALFMKDVEFYLYEPLKKKSAFLHLAKAELKCKNVHIKNQRIEDEKDMIYDLVVSRAVTKTELLLDLSKNITDEKTTYLLFKGSNLEDEKYKNFHHEIFEKGSRKYLFIKDVK